MDFLVDTIQLEAIENELNRIGKRLRYIEDRFNNICSQTDGYPFINSSYDINNIKKELISSAMNLHNYAKFLENTIKQYLSAEDEIQRVGKIIFDNILKESQSSKSKCKKDGCNAIYNNTSEKNNDIFIKPDICKLPNKDMITDKMIKSGIIDDGNNILIRSWI